MMEFKGYITGETEKRFWKRARNLGIRICLIAGAITLPIFCVLANEMQSLLPIVVYIVSISVSLLCVSLPKSEKQRRAFNPKRLRIDRGEIICLTDQEEEIRRIDEVKCVHEYEEFFEIEFFKNNAGGKFLCQKDLLTQGSLSAFRELFAKKIRKNK